jgi:hypothetical protein
MKIQLLMRCGFVYCAEIDDVLGTAALGKGAGVFDVGVPGRRNLPVKIHAGLAGQISACCLGCPHEREHSCNRPVLCQRMRPGKLDGWIVAMTRYCVCSSWKADEKYERYIKSAASWPQLLFKAEAQISKSGGESGGGVVIEKVVRDRETKLGFAGDSKSHGCFGEIKAVLASIAGLLQSVLKLQASTGDDNTRTGDLRPICNNRALRIGAASLSLRL